MADKPLPDYYGLLEVHPRASDLVIKKAFRALMAGGAHPDAGGSPERAKLLTEAYQVLADPDKRRSYDLALLMSPLPGGAPAPMHPPGAAPGTASGSAPPAERQSRPLPVPSPRRGALLAGALFLLGLGLGLGLPPALEYIEGMRAQRPDPPAGSAQARYHLGAGEAYRKSGKADEAEEHLRQAIALAPDEAAPLAALGDLLADTGRTDAAVDAYRKAASLESGDPGLYTHLGLAYLMLRDTANAAQSLHMALAIDKNFRPALVALGQVYQEVGKYADAQDLYGRAAAISGRDPDLRFRMGEVAVQMGDRERAIEEWRACLALPGASQLLRERAIRSLSDVGAWYDEGTRGFRR